MTEVRRNFSLPSSSRAWPKGSAVFFSCAAEVFRDNFSRAYMCGRGIAKMWREHVSSGSEAPRDILLVRSRGAARYFSRAWMLRDNSPCVLQRFFATFFFVRDNGAMPYFFSRVGPRRCAILFKAPRHILLVLSRGAA